MIRNLVAGFIAAAVVAAAPLQAEEPQFSRCGGGEGPKPMVDITAGFASNIELLPTKGEVKEFVSWEKRGRLLYRNASNEIFSTDLKGERKEFVSQSHKPLSRLTDPEERFLLISGERWFLDTWNPLKEWIHYTAPFNQPEHLFWHNRNLYSMSSVFTTADPNLKLYRYRAGDRTARRQCPLLKFDPNSGFRIGKGHSYPYVFLYRVTPTENGNELTLFRLNVFTCIVQNVGTYKHRIQGDVLDVHWFPALKSFAVRVDHPTHNLLWDTGEGGCRYFNVGSGPLLVLNYNRPVVATMDENDGFAMFYLAQEEAKRVKLFKDFPVSSLNPSDIWLTRDGKTLFASPELQDHTKWLMKISLPASP